MISNKQSLISKHEYEGYKQQRMWARAREMYRTRSGIVKCRNKRRAKAAKRNRPKHAMRRKALKHFGEEKYLTLRELCSAVKRRLILYTIKYKFC